jgi:carbonic anhydrase
MCSNCNGEGVGRRDILKFGAASLAAVGLGGASWSARAAEGAPTTLSPDEALAALKSGNERFVGHPELCSIDLASQRTTVRRTRRPGQRSSAAPTAACRPS